MDVIASKNHIGKAKATALYQKKVKTKQKELVLFKNLAIPKRNEHIYFKKSQKRSKTNYFTVYQKYAIRKQNDLDILNLAISKNMRYLCRYIMILPEFSSLSRFSRYKHTVQLLHTLFFKHQ